MKDTKKYYRLGNPAATAVVATELMKDKDIRSVVKKGVRTGFSVVGTTFKVIGIGIGISILVYAGSKIVKKIKENRRAKKNLKNETAGLDKKQITKSESWYTKQVENLRKALELDVHCFSDSTRSYNEDTVLSVINGCANLHDWLYLVKQFGSQTGKTYSGETEARTLTQWLGYDDESDIAKYNAALQSKGVPYESLITKLQ
jgi:hypothetical protein